MESGEATRDILIELKQATIGSAGSLGEVPVVERIDWQIKEGDYWIVGALPGSGKSELVAAAAGLQKPISGDHFLFGRKPSDLEEDQLLGLRVKIGVVFDKGARLFNTLTVSENVALPLAYHRNLRPEETRHEVDEILEWTGLTDLARKTPGDLPRTMKQRVGLARALILNPEVLLLDNPLNGVDSRQIAWWIEFLGRLSSGALSKSQRQITLVVAVDDLRPWIKAGNRFGLIQDKQWVRLGDQKELANSPEPLIKELLSSTIAKE